MLQIEAAIFIFSRQSKMNHGKYKISYSNSCDKDIYGTPTYSFLDKEGLILQDAMILQPILIPAKGSYQAKGTEMLSSKQKIDRLHSSSAGLKNLGFY